MNNLFRTVKVELKANFTIGRIAGLFIVFLIPLLMPLIRGDVNIHGDTSSDALENATWNMLGSVLSQGVIYALLLRIILLVRSNSTLDKNRALFLTMDKKQVVFGKILADTLLFMTSIILISVFGPLLIVYKNNGALSDGLVSQIALYSVGIFMLYVFISIGVMFIISRYKGKTKWMLFSTFLLLTATTYVAMSIVVGVIDDSRPLFINNELILSFVPFLNITYISLVLYGYASLWTVAPLIVEVLIFAILIWRPLSTSVKEYLCG